MRYVVTEAGVGPGAMQEVGLMVKRSEPMELYEALGEAVKCVKHYRTAHQVRVVTRENEAVVAVGESRYTVRPEEL